MDPLRTRLLNDRPANRGGDYVLYWMSAARRVRYNFGLERAVELANELERPLLVFEAVRAGYRWASLRHHAFLLRGMHDNAAACAKAGVTYYPWVEPAPGAGKGLLAALAARACAVVADEWPCFFLPRATDAAAKACETRFELVDSIGLLPIRAAGSCFVRAYDFRRFLQRELAPHLESAPQSDPLARLGRHGKDAQPPASVLRRWPRTPPTWLDAPARHCRVEGLDGEVTPVPMIGGSAQGTQRLEQFLEQRLSRYAEERSDIDDSAASGLSPYLHYGHVGTHQVFAALVRRERWKPAQLASTTNGRKEGWWGMSPGAESFLDELVTWRELGFNTCLHRPDYDSYDSLPNWAVRTLEEHAKDARPHRYTLEQLEQASTHDELWNAAQRELVRTGAMHNYLRMLWGKKVLEWSRKPREAFANLVELNNKYALDGRDPNSYSGIAWCFGRYDRPWAPVRPIFGCIRYMSSANTARKFSVKRYLERFAPSASLPFG